MCFRFGFLSGTRVKGVIFVLFIGCSGNIDENGLENKIENMRTLLQ